MLVFEVANTGGTGLTTKSAIDALTLKVYRSNLTSSLHLQQEIEGW